MSAEAGGLRKRHVAPDDFALVEQGKPAEASKDHPTKAASDLEPLNWKDLILCIILAVLTHQKALYQIEEPRSIVYDEIHFTKYSTYYLTGHFFVDIHPPLAKLIMMGVEHYNGYENLGELNVQWWTNHGYVGTMDYKQVYKDDKLTYVALRRASALTGTVLVIAMYLAARFAGCRRLVALFTASLAFFDNMIAIYSRVILTDIYLWTFHICAIGASFASVYPHHGRNAQVVWTVLTGLFLGCTLSVKYLAGGTLGFVGFHQLAHLLYTHTGKKCDLKKFVWTAVWRAGTILGLSAMVFFSVWAAHIHYLPYKGGGDGFTDKLFQDTLIPKLSESDMALAAKGGCPNKANAVYDCGWWNVTQRECEDRGCCWDPASGANFCYPKQTPSVPYVPMWQKIKFNLQATWRNNQGEAMLYHPTMSRWYQWPFHNCRIVVMSGRGRNGMIYSIGNPVGWWLVAITVIVGLAAWLIHALVSLCMRARKDKNTPPPAAPLPLNVTLLLLIVGYLACLLPFHYIKRSTWNYHYALALELGMLTVGFCMEILLQAAGPGRAWKKYAVWLLLLVLEAAVVAGFCYWAHWTYGFELTQEQHNARKWHPLWTTTGSRESYGMPNAP